MSRVALILVFVIGVAACRSEEPEPMVFSLSETEHRAADAALDTARTVAADSALARADTDAAMPERDWPAPDDLFYLTYLNDQHGYFLDYPDNLFQRDTGLNEEHGQAFVTDDGTARLLVYASAGGEGALRRLYEQELERDDRRVTYHVLRSDWFVVSGYEGPYIYYRRTFRGGDGLRTFQLRHLADDKAYFDAVVERLSYSFEG